MLSSLLLVSLLLSCGRVSRSEQPLLLSRRDISVPIGREVYIQPDDLVFSRNETAAACRVEVITDEPMTQRVGTVIPQVFDCDFDSKTVKYVHRGSPLVWNDTVRFRVSEFLNHDTISEYFELSFSIYNTSYDVIVPLRPLIVKDFSGSTHPIDDTVLNFNYSRRATCKIKMSRHFDQRPSHGQIVIGPENQAVDVIKRRCDEFLLLGLRYEHLKPPSPDIDFVSIMVEVSNPLANDVLFEWYQIPVVIEPGFPNLPPKASFSGMYLMDVDQFIVTAITPTVLSATDSETPSSLLIFNISKPLLPEQGSIIHLSADHSRAVSSFRQSDLDNFDIAYKPPSRAFKERQMFEIGFVISDPDFALSDPFTMHIAVRPALTTAPRVFMNTGLILLEGQSRPLRKENLEVVDGDNIEEVKIFVTGGLHHGSLEVNGRTAYVFTQEDISSESVVYHHDDSDSVRDSIHLRVSDGFQSSHLKFPIVVIPKDDTHPSLVTNTGLKVRKGEVQILPTLLRAADHGSLDDHIKFNVSRLPSLGTIWKRFAWEEGGGSEVSIFTQQDINRGLIYYRLLQKMVVASEDSFDLVVQDGGRPPNSSPPFTVQVQVSALHNDSPPKQDPAASFHLQVKEEGEAGVLSSDKLRYMDEADEEEIVFTITTPPRFIGTFAHPDPGKIVYLSDDEQGGGSLKSFTQRQVNHRKVGYVPPRGEIGPNPLYLQFIFSATDIHRNTVKGQQFNITVLPVNNQAPQIRTSDLWVEEGGSTLVSTNEFSVYDADTISSDLQISLFTVPLHGTLRRSDQLLRVGDLLSLDDILTLRMEYLHDGSENFRDSFKVGVNDGLHFVSGDVAVSVEPVDDEKPTFKRRGETPRISVSEGSSVLITSDVLSASDVDTKSESLYFILTEMPLLGSISLNGSKVHRFTQRSLLQDEVSYVHNNQEIGPNPKEDSLTVIVTDKMFPSPGPHESLKILITVLPVNSQPPRLLFKRTLLVEEGQQTPVAEDNVFATDDDTFATELLVIVTKEPRYGYLQSTRPAFGYESAVKNRKITAFPLQDVSNGFVSFVQSNHSDMEPESDDFEICVTDGVHNSSSVLVYVSIILVNDEVPHFYLSNVTVREDGSYVLNNESIIATDRDFPGDILLLSLKEGPRHGRLTYFLRAINNGPMLEIPFHQMAFENFDKIVYHHDGSETARDSFTLSLNDGLHSVHRSCFVTVLPLNDQPPVLKHNPGAQNVEILSYFTLNASLLMAEDGDSPIGEILYKITELPVRGVIEEMLNDTWRPLTDLTFSQEGVQLSRIRYRHTDASADTDTFTFYLTDGELNSTAAVFRVKFVDIEKERLIVINNNCSVEHGGQVVLNSSSVYAFDNTSSPQDIQFFVTKPPQYGNLMLDNDTSQAIETFTAFHLLNGQLSYRHNETLSNSGDSFSASVTNSAVEGYLTFNILILPKSAVRPVLNHSLPLRLESGHRASITPDHLMSSEPTLLSSEIVYVIREFPKKGSLLLTGKNAPNPTSFTQRDVDRGLLSYSSNEGARGNDRFYFQVFNGGEDERITQELAAFEIIVQAKPTVHIQNLTHPESVWKEGEMGFEVSRQHLRVEGGSEQGDSVVFRVSRNLEHGHLLHLRRNAKVQQFTQEDIDRGWLVIVLKKNGASTTDYFTFDVHVNDTKIADASLHLEWCVVHFVYSEYWVCEDGGALRIPLRRMGGPASAFVTLSVGEITAREGLDFVSSNRKVIQFDPGVTESHFKVVVVRDDLREAAVERLELTISQAENCLVPNPNATLIHIYDLNTNSCSRMPLKRWKEYTFSDQEDEKMIDSPFQEECSGDECGGSTQMVDDEVPSDIPETTTTTTTTTTTATTTTTLPPEECPEDWQEFGGKCHKWHRPAAPWSGAQSACEEQQGSLVSVDSLEHNQWLLAIARNRPFWIGNNQHQQSGFTNWKKGSASSGRHRCVLVRGSGVWIHKNCEANQSFVCERPPS